MTGEAEASPEYHRKSNAFFIRPYLATEQIIKSGINDITLTFLGSEPEHFRGNLYTIPVVNKHVRVGYVFSRTAYNCRIGLSIVRDNRTLFEELRLRWLGSNSLPVECNYGASLEEGITKREQYARRLPKSYLGSLFANSSDTTKFVVGTENNVLLLFTFEGSKQAYVITYMPRTVISLDFNVEYLFHVRFHSDGYRELYKNQFKFIAKSWDNIAFEEMES